MSIDGNWKITIKSPMGPMAGTLSLASSGDSLTGTQTAQGQTSEIQDGKIAGDQLTWKNAITSPMAMTLEFAVTVSGDKLSGAVKAGPMGSFPLEGERA